MRKLITVAASIMALACPSIVVASADAYQNVSNGFNYALPQAGPTALTNLGTKFNPDVYTFYGQTGGCFGGLNYYSRHGDEDVTYCTQWIVEYPSGLIVRNGAGNAFTDRIKVRVIGPNSNMHVMTLTDDGYGWQPVI